MEFEQKRRELEQQRVEVEREAHRHYAEVGGRTVVRK